jgi:hypothetical protein
MSGGKGGSQTTQVEIPQWLENAARANLAQGREVSRIGYTPYYGPDVAALTPTQQAARSNVGQFAKAFGLQGVQDMALGQPTTYDGGIQGYSSGSLYDQAVQELAAKRPGQYGAIQRQFINPYAGMNQAGGAGGADGGGDEPLASNNTYQDPYASYFFTDDTSVNRMPSYENNEFGHGMPSVQNLGNAESYANAYAESQASYQPANIAYNGQVYDLNNPEQAAAYQAAYAAANTSAGAAQPTATEVVADLRSASDWKTLGTKGKIDRAVAAANQYGLSAEDLAPVLGLPASTIRGYL